jgi:hypothetical protein
MKLIEYGGQGDRDGKSRVSYFAVPFYINFF